MSVIYKKIEFLSDDRLLRGIFFSPHHETKYVVLFIHGGGKRTTNRYEEWQKYLASRDLASLFFFCRGVGESGGEFSEGSLSNRLRDTQEALGFLEKTLGFTKENIILIASSMGGHVACRLVEKYPSIPVLILQSAAAYGQAAERIPLSEEFSRFIHKESGWKNSPAFSCLARFRGAVLVIYGKKDDVIPKGVQTTYRSLIRTGKFISIPEAGHQLLSPKTAQDNLNRQKLYQVSYDFISINLKR